MDFFIAFLIVVSFVGVWLAVSALFGKRAEKQVFREMGSALCPTCGSPLGVNEVSSGKESTPWEELWGDENDSDEFIHHYPRCRQVTCVNCKRLLEIRLNTEGESIGPRLSVREIDNESTSRIERAQG